MQESPGIIDVHVHTFPTADLGRRALGGRGRSGASGTVEELLTVMQQGAIDRAVMVNITPVAEMRTAAESRSRVKEASESLDDQLAGRLRRRNLWTCQVAAENPALIASVDVDPNLMSAVATLEHVEECSRLGAQGLTLHPANHCFYPDDRRLWPVYERAEELGLRVFAQSGLGLLPGTDDYGRPVHFGEALSAFPQLKFVLGHMGRGYRVEPPKLVQRFQNVWFDTSFAISASFDSPELSDRQAVDAITTIGTDRVVFGSDWPWCDPVKDADRIRRLQLPDEAKESILFGNAEELLQEK